MIRHNKLLINAGLWIRTLLPPNKELMVPYCHSIRHHKLLVSKLPY